MFRSDNDIKKVLDQIRSLKELIDQHIRDKAEPVPPSAVMELEKLKVSLGFFVEFNRNFLKSLGYSPEDINRLMRMNIKGRDPKLEALFQEADSLKCQILLSQAAMVKHQYKDFLENSRPFQEVSPLHRKGMEKVQKKRVKKKFKSMSHRMKWNRM